MVRSKKEKRSYSGQFMARMSPGLHEALVKLAKENERSLMDEVREAARRHVLRAKGMDA